MEFNKEFIGTWHNTPSVGSGYGARYYFFNNGTFIYKASEMDGETRIRTKKGIWSIKEDKLILLVNEIEEIVGGQKVLASGSIGTEYEIEGGKLETKVVDFVEEYTLSSMKTNNVLWRPMVEINDMSFWRYTSDPNSEQ